MCSCLLHLLQQNSVKQQWLPQQLGGLNIDLLLPDHVALLIAASEVDAEVRGDALTLFNSADHCLLLSCVALVDCQLEAVDNLAALRGCVCAHVY